MSGVVSKPLQQAATPKLKVYVITEDDPLYVIRFFGVFFAELPSDRIEIVGMTISRAFHESILSTARRVHRFYGTVDFLRLLVRWFRAKVSGRRISAIARASGVRLFSTSSVNEPDFVAHVRNLSVDVVVSVAAPEVFKRDLLSAPRLGCINIHSGRLPEYRGMMPTFWQLLAGERHATVTIHEMAERLDAGGVISTLEFPLRDRDSLDRVIVGTKEAGGRLMIDTLLRFDARTGERPIARQFSLAGGSYHRFPDPASVRRFRERGHRML
jgi:methionyl-tRNA formyltransferase